MSRRHILLAGAAAAALILGPASGLATAEQGGASPGGTPPTATTPTTPTAPPTGTTPGGTTGTGRDGTPQTPPDDGAPDQPAPLQVTGSTLTQSGGSMLWTATTATRWSPASLRRDRQSLCLRLVYETSVVNSRDVCVRRTGATVTLTLARVLRSGGDGPLNQLTASTRKPSPRSLRATITLARLGIPQGTPVRWRTLARTDGCSLTGSSACFSARPADGAVLQLRLPLPYGCTPGGQDYWTNGSRDKKVVALTFDDGPSIYTPQYLAILRQKRVHATFFEIGEQVSSYAETVRQILAQGNEIGDHTWNHADVSAGGAFASSEITRAADAIQQASGFRPCAFRAPGGAVSGSLESLARGLGFNTIEWDVDPRDWALPGTDAIYNTVVNTTHNGSIVLMHDGGGNRTETIAALPRIIDTLRARGYSFETISQMTGERMKYR
ncbi:MAG TPA: polysaccharide deacetylase family protein [Conexibacter sp.]|jgi:peptidoglycan/xylan/chitin deacetylase (PgdA/CDA1 family)